MDVVISALNLAGIYALVALGVSLTWAGLGFLNLAYGVTFAAAGYGAWLTADHVSTNGLAVVCGAVLFGAFVGLVVWALAFIPLDGRARWDTRSLIATLAISLIGTNLLLEVFGPRNKGLPAIFGEGQVNVLGTVVTADKIGAIVSATVLLGLVLLALRRTRVGLAVRALTQDTEGAALVGIDRRTAALAILGVSGALVGVAAVLLSQTFYVAPNAGYVPMVKGFIVALLGGLGSISGMIVAAIMVGATEALTASYLGGEYVLMTLFALIAVVLLVRPRGVAGVLESSRA